MELRGRRRDVVQLDLTSLIDVVFILVIFVVLAASFERIRALEIELPEASTAAPAPAEALVLTVPVQGALTIDGAETTLEALPAALKAGFRPERPVILQVDAAARVDRAVKVLDAVRAAGFSNVAVATREAPP